MKILPLKRRNERGMVGPVLALLVIVIGVVICYKIYKLASTLLPPPPPPPPPCQTNAPGTTNPPIIVTNMSADSAWIILGPDTNTPPNTMNVMFGLMSTPANSLLPSQVLPVMVGCTQDSQVGGLDPSNVLAQIQGYYGVAYPGAQVENGHGEYQTDPDTGALTWHSWSVQPTNITYSDGLITVAEWHTSPEQHTVVLQRSPDGVSSWTNLCTNTMSAGQFQLYRDTAAPVQSGFYRTMISQ